jgi:hypothetical protein
LNSQRGVYHWTKALGSELRTELGEPFGWSRLEAELGTSLDGPRLGRRLGG